MYGNASAFELVATVLDLSGTCFSYSCCVGCPALYSCIAWCFSLVPLRHFFFLRLRCRVQIAGVDGNAQEQKGVASNLRG